MPRSFLVKKNAKQAASGLKKLQHGIATTAYDAGIMLVASYPEMSVAAPVNIPHPVIHKPEPLQAIPNPSAYWRHHQNVIYSAATSPFEADTFPHIHKGYSPPPPFSQPLHAHLPQPSLHHLLTPTPIIDDENRMITSLSPNQHPHHHHHHHHPHPHHRQQHLQASTPAAATPTATAAAKPEKEIKKRRSNKNGEDSTKYHCPDCGKEYSTFGGLSKHRQLHCDAQNKKTFNCKYCDKEYMSLGALKMHIRTHTLPCKCKFCGKAFSRPWLLQGHIRTHTGEKPFSCPHCQRAFADRSNLRAHLQTHSEVKKYSCKSCGKTFSRMSLLNKHEESGCISSSSD